MLNINKSSPKLFKQEQYSVVLKEAKKNNKQTNNSIENNN